MLKTLILYCFVSVRSISIKPSGDAALAARAGHVFDVEETAAATPHAAATQPGQDAVVTHLPADPGVRLLDRHRPPHGVHGRSVDRRLAYRFIGQKGFDLAFQGSITITRPRQKRRAFVGWQFQCMPKQPADPLMVFRGHECRLD